MKLQDYAQYYLGCRCLNTWFPENHPEYNNNWNLVGVCVKHGKPFKLENDDSDTATDSIKLILRTVDSMTRNEWDDVKMRLSADVVLTEASIRYKDKPYWVIILENRINTNTLRFNDGIELIRLGYDLFGLIENGLAIDSKTLK